MRAPAFIALAFAGAIGCGRVDATTLSETPCPPGGTALTYASFGASFMDTWCQGCHGQPVGARKGAKLEHDFGSREAIIEWSERIFVNAAADNTAMPPGPEDPPSAERAQLAEWLACGTP